MLVLRLFFMAIVLVPTVSYSEDRPYFWGTDLSENYSYVELGYSKKRLKGKDTSFIEDRVSYNSRSTTDGPTNSFKYTSARLNGLVVSLERNDSRWRYSPNVIFKRITNKYLEFGLNFKKGDMIYKFDLQNNQSWVGTSDFLNLLIQYRPNDLWTYSAAFSETKSFLDIGLIGYPVSQDYLSLGFGAKYEKDTRDYDLELSGNWLRSRGTFTSTANTITRLGSVTDVSAHALKKLEAFKLGLGFSGSFNGSQGPLEINGRPKDNSLNLKLMSVYTAETYEVSINLGRSKVRMQDNTSLILEDKNEDSIELAYKKALNDDWFINFTADHAVSSFHANSKSSLGRSYKQRTEDNSWNISIIKRF